MVASVGARRGDHPGRLGADGGGANETELPVAPLTTAVSSREYLVGGTFTGTVTGGGKTKLSGGTLEAGYQIGCGIELGQVRLIGQAGVRSVWASPVARPPAV